LHRQVSRHYASLAVLALFGSNACSQEPRSESFTERAEALTLPGITLKTVAIPRFIGAQNGGGGAVLATATVAQGWETFSLEDVNGGTLESGDSVLIRAGNGQFFQASNGGGSSLNAASNNQLGWETFKIVRQSGAGNIKNDDVVGLQTASGAWISAQNGGGNGVFAFGGALGSWEQLRIAGLAVAPPAAPPPTPAAASVANVNFRTQLAGRYVTAQNGGGGSLTASATSAQAWESFTLEDVNGGTLQSGDSVFIRVGTGQYWQAANGGGSTLDAGSSSKLAAETFKIVRQSGGGTIAVGDVVGLQASSGAWVSAENGGGGSVWAYGGALGSWEQLVYGVGQTQNDSSAPNTPGQPTLANGRGAIMSFVEYEAENMQTNGAILGPTRAFGQVAAEASGRRAVRLSATGQYVQLTNRTPSNSIVVRYSIPDAGESYWVSLGVYVNGALRTRLALTSRYSWTYGGDADFNQSWQNDPGRGNAHHFFDEARALVGDIPVGASVTLRKDAGDAAASYDIDLVDMEAVPGPQGQPSGYLSLSDCGATANDGSDDSGAIQACVDRARGEGRGLYIPQGTFDSFSRPISAGGVTIRGAGMWYSTINGYNARFDCWANNCKYYDFAVFGDSTQRLDDATDTAFTGNGSSGVLLENIWVEHTRVGYWTGPGTNGLTIRSSRFRDLFADGINLYGGTSDSVCENNHLRNTGDDALAAWSDTANGYGPDRNNVFRKNYVQLPWKANCFALYGGDGNRIEDNVCADVVQYPGILLAREFNAHAFTGTTSVARNTLIRAGAWAYGQEQGALKIHADQADVSGINVTDLELISPTYYGVHMQGLASISNVNLSGVSITSPGSGSFFLNWGSRGSLTARGVTATGSPQGVRNDSAGNFNLIRGAGNSGW
jgi:hypothetical protein